MRSYVKEPTTYCQVRAELLNGALLDGYRIANPRFREPSGFS
jgi:hypothetical protein